MAILSLDEPSVSALKTLGAQAAARGIPLAEHLRALAEWVARVDDAKPALDAEAFARWVAEIGAGGAGIEPLPSDFSRTDIYFDHD